MSAAIDDRKRRPHRVARPLTVKVTDRQVLILWGEKDRAFGPEKRERWEVTFADHRTYLFPGAGHFVPEELGDGALAIIRCWLKKEEAANA